MKKSNSKESDSRKCEICSNPLNPVQKFTCCEECRKTRKSNYDRIRNEILAKENVIRVREYRKGRGSDRWEKEREKIKNDPMRYYYKNILTLLSRYLRKGISPKYSKIINLLPFKFIQLKEKLENNIPEGYNWEDYVNGNLHLDHEKPHSMFSYSHHSDHEFLECWSLSNLRLLPKSINIKRQNKSIKSDIDKKIENA